MAVHIPGLIMMVAFYLLVLGIGIWASVKSKKMQRNALGAQLEVSFLASRRISLFMGVFTMTGEFGLDFLNCFVCSVFYCSVQKVDGNSCDVMVKKFQ